MIYRKFTVLLICMILIGCATKMPIDKYPDDLIKAIELQNKVLSAPRFKEILRELEASNDINWVGRTEYIKEELASYGSNAEWALDKFEIEGPFDAKNLRFWWKLNPPWSSTTAATFTNGDSISLNRWKLRRDASSFLNTLIHERVHSFGLIHPENQKRETNQCDFSYISGDLSRSIVFAIDRSQKVEFSKPMCPALCASLQSRGMHHGC